MAQLTKRDLVLRISRETGLVQQDVLQALQKTLDYMTDALARGQNIELRNFGVFEIRLARARVGRNPRKPADDIVVPSRATVKFKSGKVLHKRVLLLTNDLENQERARSAS